MSRGGAVDLHVCRHEGGGEASGAPRAGAPDLA